MWLDVEVALDVIISAMVLALLVLLVFVRDSPCDWAIYFSSHNKSAGKLNPISLAYMYASLTCFKVKRFLESLNSSVHSFFTN